MPYRRSVSIMKLLMLFLWLAVAVEAAPCIDKQQCATCESNGRCVSKCYKDYYGLKCNHQCSTGCRDNLCHMVNGIGYCTYGCKAGFYGTRCNIHCEPHLKTCRKCPQECEEGFCRLESSCVQGCQDSYYGNTCKSCPAGCEVCNRVSGTCEVCLHCEGNCSQGCTEGCRPGYFGDFCEHKCSSGCLSGCNQTSGDCVECKAGWFGRVCEKQCSHRCIDKTCKIDGNCINGCIEGWYGPKCETKCQRGCHRGICTLDGTCADGCKVHFYGKHCENQCSASCLNRVCDAEDGTCQSCEKRFYGSHCNNSCVRCIEGFCAQDTGQCNQGCLPNYRGEFCQHDCGGNCTTDECFQVCKSKTQQYWIGGISLIFIIFLVIVVYVTYHFKRIDNKNINRVTWRAETGTATVEQDSSSLSESDCSQMGVQVVILKQPDAESIVSLDDEVVDKAVADKELLKKIIVEEDLPSVSYKVSRLDVAGTKGDSRYPGNTSVSKKESEMSMEQDSQFGNAFAKCKMMRDDEKGMASCSDYFSGDRKCKMRTIMEKDNEYYNDADDGKILRSTGKKEIQFCDGNGIRKSSQIVEDKLVFDDSVEYKNQIAEYNTIEKSIDDSKLLKVQNVCLSNILSDGEKGAMSVKDAFTYDKRVRMPDEVNNFKDWHGKAILSVVDEGPGCVEGASAKITEISRIKDDQFEEHENDDQDLDVPENWSMTYDGNGFTLEAADERQPESAGPMNTEPQLTLDVPDNLSMIYDGNGSSLEAADERQPESAGPMNTEPQLTLDVPDNLSMIYDGNGSTLEAADERQPERAGVMNTEPQLTLDVPDNLSMTYDGNGTNQEAERGRQPESAGAMNTEPQLTEAQVNDSTEQKGKNNQSGIVSINEHDNDKHYVEVFLMND